MVVQIRHSGSNKGQGQPLPGPAGPWVRAENNFQGPDAQCARAVSSSSSRQPEQRCTAGQAVVN